MASLLGTPGFAADEAAKSSLPASDSAKAAANSSSTASREGNDANAAAQPTTAAPDPAILLQLKELKEQLDAQRHAFDEQEKRVALLESELSAAKNSPSPSSVAGNSSSAPIVPPEPAVQPAVENQPAPSAAQQSGQPQINITQPEHPVSFKIGAADFTPGGFADITAYYRSKDVGSGLGTSFGSIPYNNALPQGGLSEFRFTSQSSRLSLKVDANVTKDTAVTGYVESDFNGYQPPNAYQSTNSSTFRLRLYWVDITHGKWEVLGGQSWSLLTANRYGLSPNPGDVFTTLRLDTNYVAGLVFARQAGFRVVYHPSSWWAIGAAFENPEQFAPSSVVFPGAAGYFGGQFDNGSGSTSATSASTNTATPNLHPDVIVKTAFDWKPAGRAFHLEAAGIIRSFRDFNNLVTPAATATTTGGAGSVNLNFEVLKGLHLIADTFYGDGGGRYISGLGPDVIVRPDGTISVVHSGSGVAGFEWQAKQNLLFDGYYGGAYFQRNYGLSPGAATASCAGNAGFTCVGFGYPGSANTANRAIQEGTFGVIPTLWSSPNYGKLQLITQYSYVVRNPWSAPAAGPRNAHAILGYADLRYILP
jgi:hypothetical protein